MTKDKKFCGATTRQAGTPCQRPAGWGTSHFGEGRCKLHGGCTPVKHGRYSKLKNPLGIKIQEHKQDTNPLDMTDELATLKALLEAWLEKTGDTGQEQAAITGAVPLIDGIRKTVDTIHKMQTRDLLTHREQEAVIEMLIRIITEEVNDQDTIGRISSRLASAFNVRPEVAGRVVEDIE